jgi:hypothetical protein
VRQCPVSAAEDRARRLRTSRGRDIDAVIAGLKSNGMGDIARSLGSSRARSAVEDASGVAGALWPLLVPTIQERAGRHRSSVDRIVVVDCKFDSLLAHVEPMDDSSALIVVSDGLNSLIRPAAERVR